MSSNVALELESHLFHRVFSLAHVVVARHCCCCSHCPLRRRRNCLVLLLFVAREERKDARFRCQSLIQSQDNLVLKAIAVQGGVQHVHHACTTNFWRTVVCIGGVQRMDVTKDVSALASEILHDETIDKFQWCAAVSRREARANN